MCMLMWCQIHQQWVRDRICKCRKSRQRKGDMDEGWKKENRWTMDRTTLLQLKEDLSIHLHFFSMWGQCERKVLRERWMRRGWAEDDGWDRAGTCYLKWSVKMAHDTQRLTRGWAQLERLSAGLWWSLMVTERLSGLHWRSKTGFWGNSYFHLAYLNYIFLNICVDHK